MSLSPLHAAVEAGDLVRVQELVDAGADIEERDNIYDPRGHTPLYRAVNKGYLAHDTLWSAGRTKMPEMATDGPH